MLNSLRAGVLALAAMLCAPAVAMAACPAAPTYTGLTGKDATPATQTMQTVTSAGSGNQLSTPLIHGNDGTATPKAVAIDANCNLEINLQTPVPAGTNLMGKVGIDQTTPGTTDSVTIKAGAVSNASSGVGTASTNYATVAYNYCWNGTTWDQCFAPTPAYAATPTTGITRPADTTQYAANDTWADSTSAPTTGGFTLSSACRTSGGGGTLVSLTVVSSIDPTVYLQGEIWLFDSAVTAVNDNAAFALSDSDALKLIPGGVIPFTLASSTGGAGTNSLYTAGALSIAYNCSGSADLRYLVKVKNAYTPASGEVLTVRAAVIGTK